MNLAGLILMPTRNPILRLLGSLWTGMTLLTLILIYACVFSAIPQARFAVEFTEMSAFSHWIFTTLIVTMCICVVIATLTRISLSVMNLGVWIIHAGLLIFCAGSILYFGTKVEGDVTLESPRVQLRSNTDQRVLAEVAAEADQTWAANMPMAGGSVGLRVVSVDGGTDSPVHGVTLSTQSGDAQPKAVRLTAENPVAPLNDRVTLQLVLPESRSKFYDKELAALYVRPAGQPQWQGVPLPTLPFHRERYPADITPLTDANGKPVPSKRATPSLSLLGLSIPTAWFEGWKLPIDVPIEGAPFDVTITGFTPFVAGFAETPEEGGSEINPALVISVAVDKDKIGERALFALDPVRAVWPRAPIELRWAKSPEEREAWLAPLAGPDELLVETTNPPTRRAYSITANQSITIEGTPYSLVIQQLLPSWPMMSPGFENSSSPAALVEVNNGQTKFTRTVIERFPQLSQDIDASGKRLREGFVDANISMHLRSSLDGRWLIVGEPGGKLTLGVFDARGNVKRHDLSLGTMVEAPLFGGKFAITPERLIEKARVSETPVLQPIESRSPPNDPRERTAVLLRFDGKGPLSGWHDMQWASYTPYPFQADHPLLIQPPGTDKAWEFALSRAERPLGFDLLGRRLHVNFFPGRRSADTWQSDFFVRAGDSGSYAKATVLTNRTHEVGGLTLFQSGADPNHWRFTTLGVGNRRGIPGMVLGSVMIPLGSLYAFYLKPVLRRRRVEKAQAEALEADVARPETPTRDLVEAR